MSWYRDLTGLNLGELIDRFRACPPEGEEYASSYYPDVALRIRELGQPGVDFLLAEIDKADTEQLRAILLALTTPKLECRALHGRLLGYLNDPRPLIVAEAIDGLRSQGETDATGRVLALRNHPSPFVRGAVLHFMSGLHPATASPLLIAALEDPDYIVRENAVDELDRLGVASAIPYIRSLLEDPHPHVREAAETAMEGLQARVGGSS